MDFSGEEQMLMMLYNPGSRLGLIAELSAMKGQLTLREKRLCRLANRVIAKLEQLSDGEFDKLDFYPIDKE